MKNEPLRPEHGSMIARFARIHGLYFSGSIHQSSKAEFFKIWWCFHDLVIITEPRSLQEKYQLSFEAHVKKISLAIQAYKAGTGTTADCWECLGWAVAWYFQSKIL